MHHGKHIMLTTLMIVFIPLSASLSADQVKMSNGDIITASAKYFVTVDGEVNRPGRYAVESDKPQRKPFDPVDVLRTPYRIDILQPVYFVIDSFDDLFELAQADLLGYIQEARKLGMHTPLFEAA